MLAVVSLLASLAMEPACAPDEGSVDDVFEAELPGDAHRLPLTSVTGVAASAHGLVVGGVSTDADLFWDAWLVPADGGAARRLAPIGNNLVAIDGAGALWTDITDYGPSGTASYENRLSPWDGSPSVLLSQELPSGFAAERAVVDEHGGWLLAGSEDLEGATRGAVFAVDAGGRARRLPCELGPEPPLFLDAALAGDVLQLTVQHAPEGPASIVKVPRRSADQRYPRTRAPSPLTVRANSRRAWCPARCRHSKDRRQAALAGASRSSRIQNR